LDPSSLPPDLKVHEAGIVLLPQNFITPANFPLVGPFLEAMDDDWIACSARYPGAPPLPISGGIASGAQAVDGSIHYDSDAVAAHVQNVLRGAPNRGFIARSTRSLSYIATATTSGFRIVYYRPQGTIGGAHP
jgi:hypothetical protein